MSNDDCNYLSYCQKPSGQCSGEGKCFLKTVMCVGYDDPVCGCDGLTHVNECFAAARGGVSVDYSGDAYGVKRSCVAWGSVLPFFYKLFLKILNALSSALSYCYSPEV